MNKIKDFIYDKNDLLVSLLVLVLAALIIMWRMEIIMDYPKQVFAAENGGTSQGDASDPAGEAGENDESGTGSDETGQDGTGENGESGTGEDGSGEGGTDENGEGGTPDDTQSSDSFWDGDVLARDVVVTVTGYTATDAIGCLVDAGLFENYSEYQQICEANGMNHEQVSAGVITFPAGSSKKDIARQINWS